MALDSAKPTKSQRYHQSSASAWLKDQRLTDSLYPMYAGGVILTGVK